MDVNFNKYSHVSFLTFVCTVFISSKNHIHVLNRSSKAGAALVKTITSLEAQCTSVAINMEQLCHRKGASLNEWDCLIDPIGL